MKRVGTFLLLLGLAAAWLPAQALDLDRRRMLNAQEQVPWRAVGRVNVATMSMESMCTGTLIAQDLVLTAAHCVLSPLTGKPYPVGSVQFVAGWRLGQMVAARVAKRIAVDPDYTLSEHPDARQIAADLALIRLDRQIPRSLAPHFEVGREPPRGTPLTLISYRQDRPNALTRQQGCEVLDVEGPVMTLGCDVTFGASGSPLFAMDGGRPRIVAVVSAKGSDGRRPLAFAVLADTGLPKVMAALR